MSHVCTCAETASDEERLARLDAIIGDWRDRPGALIPVLQMAQSLFGHLPDPVLKRIAQGLDTPFSEVAGVVGFYSYFSTVKRGDHTLRVCLGTACYVRGAKQALETFKQHLGVEVGGTTEDHRFTLEEARCFGACGIAPTAMVDEDVHQRLTPAKAAAVVAQYT